MELRKAEAIIEALLFASGDVVELNRISDILEVDKDTVKAIITNMIDNYDYQRRGIRILQLGDSYQMCTRHEYFEYIERLAEPKRSATLSSAALEVLAVIAYRQPITRGAIERIRGVDCDALVDKLLERQFIEEKGRLNAPGRPILFGTTHEFLRCFGLATLEDLPDYEIINAFADQKELEKTLFEASVVD